MMLSAELLSSLREYVQSHYRPEPLHSKRQAVCAPLSPAASASVFESTEPKVFSSPYTEAEADAAPKTAPFLNDDSFCDIINIFNVNRLERYVAEHQNPSFSSELIRLIDESGCRDSEIYNRAGIDRRHFSKIRSNPDYHPSKQTAAAFCLALRLSKDVSEELLAAAGYTFSSSELFDLVISFCLENGIYDLSDVNTALVYFSLKPIGAAE